MSEPRKQYRKTGLNHANQKFAYLYVHGDKSKGIRPNNATAARREVFGAGPSPIAERKHAHDLVTNLHKSIEEYRKELESMQKEANQGLREHLSLRKNPSIRQRAIEYVSDQNFGKATQTVESRAIYAHVVMDLTGSGDQPPDDVLKALKD